MQMLDAVINLKDNFSDTLKAVESNVGEFQRTYKRTGRDIQRTGRNIESTGSTLTKGLTLPLLGALGASAKLGMDFEKTMSSVEAVTEATGKELEKLETTARKMGKTTTKSSSEAAEAMEYMGLAGWETSQIVEGIEPVLRLSEAGNVDLARASDLVTDSMSAMGIEVQDLDGYLDTVAQTARSSNTDIDAMMEAYLGVGGVLRGLDVELEDSAVALGMLANAGIKGSESGKSLSAILTNLTAPTGRAKKALDELGFSAFDSQGKFKGIDEVLFDLKDTFKDMTPEQENMYKSMIAGKEHTKGLNALLNGLDDGYEELTESIGDSEGALMSMAEIMNDNEAGSLSRLLSSVQELALTIYDKLKPAIADVIDFFQKLSDKLNDLTPEQEDMIEKFVKMAIVIGPAIAIIGKMTTGVGGLVKKFGFFAERLKNLGLMKALFTPGVKVALVLGALTAAGVLVYKNWDTIKEKALELKERFSWVGEAAGKVKDKFLEFKEKITELKDQLVDFKNDALETTREKLNSFKETIEENKETIEIISGVLLTVFGPALLMTGTQAVIAGSKIVASFVASLVKTGAQAALSGMKLMISFVGSLITAGAQAVVTGAQITVSFIASLIKTSAQAVVTGATITASLIGTLIQYAAQGWATVASITATIASWVAQKAVMLASAAASGVMTAAQWALNAALAANPITIVIGLLVALGAAMVVAYQKSETFRNIVSGAWNGIKSVASTVTSAVKSGWNSVVSVFETVSSKVESVSGTIKDSWGSVKDFMKNPIKGTVNVAKKGWNAVKNIGNNYKGTDNWRGGPTWVHEKGPEIIDLPSGSRVYPHGKSLQMAKEEGKREGSGSGGSSVTVTGNTFHVRKESDIDAIASALAEKLTDTSANMA